MPTTPTGTKRKAQHPPQHPNNSMPGGVDDDVHVYLDNAVDGYGDLTKPRFRPRHDF